MKVTKTIGLHLYVFSKKKFFHRKLQITHKFKLKPYQKNEPENVRSYAMKIQQIVERGRCKESAATFNINCNENFTRRVQRKLKDIQEKGQIKHKPTAMKPSIPFHTLVKLADAQDITKEKKSYF